MFMERLGRPAGIQGPNGRIATMRKHNAILDRGFPSLDPHAPHYSNQLRLQPYCDRVGLSCNPWMILSAERLKG